MSLVKYYPRKSLMNLNRDMNRYFNQWGLNLNEMDTVWRPRVDIVETENAYQLQAELPGMDKKDIEVKVENDVLTLKGERKREEKNEESTFARFERTYGMFERKFHLPEDVKADEIKAKYENGILSLDIPKAEKVKPREITVG